MTLDVILKHPDAKAPEKATPYSAGYDLYSVEQVTLPPGGWRMVNIGIIVGIPLGYEGQVRPRSGLANKHGITILNAPGTIDSDYRGENCLVKVILFNASDKEYTVQKGDRVAQLVLHDVQSFTVNVVEAILPLGSGRFGGFGSTGR